MSQMGEVPVEVLISDYKDFGGVLMPTKHDQKAAGQEFTTTINSVKVTKKFRRSASSLPPKSRRC